MRAKNRREFLKSSAATFCAVGLSGMTLAEVTLANAGGGFTSKPDSPSIKKGLVMSMLPEKLSLADRFKLARDTGFEVIQAPTTPDAKQAEEIKAAADASGVHVDFGTPAATGSSDHRKCPARIHAAAPRGRLVEDRRAP